ncbi:uncharacterized protein MELLADRAFT_92034 [Melampsora larici-populina 98AG31]|uniref:Uncharacterized protein n=1 Tax=Melampsora larici-populina (strain 98AG31 / pathotype 3-4-7) TaxID=747676 RepID=F4S1A5_MELLP|nr:uncharacterized protein MELLADRAFT_92034 [Melampsora larici-populina 98AG31]EGG01594.1 hypothetical protein MELLADRAFT_92034 [Melampsora larici-populina 98AG31]
MKQVNRGGIKSEGLPCGLFSSGTQESSSLSDCSKGLSRIVVLSPRFSEGVWSGPGDGSGVYPSSLPGTNMIAGGGGGGGCCRPRLVLRRGVCRGGPGARPVAVDLDLVILASRSSAARSSACAMALSMLPIVITDVKIQLGF